MFAAVVTCDDGGIGTAADADLGCDEIKLEDTTAADEHPPIIVRRNCSRSSGGAESQDDDDDDASVGGCLC